MIKYLITLILTGCASTIPPIEKLVQDNANTPIVQAETDPNWVWYSDLDPIDYQITLDSYKLTERLLNGDKKQLVQSLELSRRMMDESRNSDMPEDLKREELAKLKVAEAVMCELIENASTTLNWLESRISDLNNLMAKEESE